MLLEVACTRRDADAERAAVSLMQAGSISGLEAVVRLHQVRALKTAYAITHSQASAEDVVADAFLRAFERIRRFDSSRPFGPWFLRIVVNLSIKEARRAFLRDRLHLNATGVEAEPSVDPACAVEARDQARHLGRAMRQLSPRLRAVMVLHYFLELDVAETAGILGCPAGTVKRRLHDARQKLHASLARDLEPAVTPRMEKEM